jgi:hypothetical protein
MGRAVWKRKLTCVDLLVSQQHVGGRSQAAWRAPVSNSYPRASLRAWGRAVSDGAAPLRDASRSRRGFAHRSMMVNRSRGLAATKHAEATSGD